MYWDSHPSPKKQAARGGGERQGGTTSHLSEAVVRGRRELRAETPCDVVTPVVSALPGKPEARQHVADAPGRLEPGWHRIADRLPGNRPAAVPFRFAGRAILAVNAGKYIMPMLAPATLPTLRQTRTSRRRKRRMIRIL